MADNQVNILIEVIAKGQAALKEVDKGMADLSKRAAESTAVTLKSDNALTKSNVTLGKQIPILRELSPLLDMAGLGFIAGATGIAAIGAGAMMANQAFETWMSGTLGLAVANNTLTGGNMSLGEAIKTVTELSDKFNITQGDVATTLGILDGVTGKAGTSMDLLADAVKISHDTGLPLIDVIKQMAIAWHDGSNVVDEFGAHTLVGKEAVLKLEQQLEATTSTFGATTSFIDSTWAKTWEGLTTGVGAVVNTLIELGKVLLMLQFNPFELLEQGLKAIFQFDLKAWFSNLFGDIGGWLKGVGHSLGIPGMATGGLVTSGGMAVVGENGPELAMFPAGASVSPLGSGGAGMTLIFNISGSVMAERELTQVVMDAIDTSVRIRGGH